MGDKEMVRLPELPCEPQAQAFVDFALIHVDPRARHSLPQDIDALLSMYGVTDGKDTTLPKRWLARHPPVLRRLDGANLTPISGKSRWRRQDVGLEEGRGLRGRGVCRRCSCCSPLPRVARQPASSPTRPPARPPRLLPSPLHRPIRPTPARSSHGHSTALATKSEEESEEGSEEESEEEETDESEEESGEEAGSEDGTAGVGKAGGADEDMDTYLAKLLGKDVGEIKQQRVGGGGGGGGDDEGSEVDEEDEEDEDESNGGGYSDDNGDAKKKKRGNGAAGGQGKGGAGGSRRGRDKVKAAAGSTAPVRSRTESLYRHASLKKDKIAAKEAELYNHSFAPKTNTRKARSRVSLNVRVCVNAFCSSPLATHVIPLPRLRVTSLTW